MIRSSLFTTLVLSTVLTAGCLSSKKGPRAKESSAIAREVEEGFRQRWVEQRTTHLVAQGTPASTARPQAETEFRERFAFTKAGK